MRVAPDLSTNVRVVENQLRKEMPRSKTDWLPRSKTDWLLVCNETFRVDMKRELPARVGVHAM